MSEFEAYNRKMKQWEIFSLSKYSEISRNKDYHVAVINPEVI